jgi:5-formyltetrahydrofolate cyclo-ligase
LTAVTWETSFLMKKKQARKLINKEFNKLSKENKSSFDEKIFKHFKSFFEGYDGILNIGSYWALSNEVESSLINDYLISKGLNLFLPRISNQKNIKKLNFYKYSKNEILEKNKYGIPEPPQKNKYIDLIGLDLVIIPLRAFDLNFSRLGYGGGYYDSSLQNVKKENRIGLSYEFQKINKIDFEKHDIELGGVITPDGYFKKA